MSSIYYLIKDGQVIQKQPYFEPGFIEGPSHISGKEVVPGCLYDGKTFKYPIITEEKESE